MQIDTAIFVALISATISFIVQYYFKRMDYKKNSKTIELALLAEISAIIIVIEERGYYASLEKIIKGIENKSLNNPLLTINIQENVFPIYNNNLDKIGVLDKNIIVDIVMFYALLNSVIQDVIDGGGLNDPSIEKSEMYKETYNILSQALEIGKKLIKTI